MMGLALAPTPALINIDKTSFYKFSFKEYQFLNICNYKKSETKKSFFLKVSWMSTLNEDSVIYEESKKPSVDHNASTHSYFKHMNHHCMSCITREFAFIMLWFKGSNKYTYVLNRSDGSFASSKWEAQFGKLYSPFVSRFVLNLV